MMFEKLIQLNRWRIETLNHDSEDRYTGAAMYVDQMREEIDEMEEEIKPNNVVYLEDELGDVLRDYFCLIHGLEYEGLIDGLDSILARCHQKFSERLAGYPHQDRQGVKHSQKKTLADEHTKRYGTE